MSFSLADILFLFVIFLLLFTSVFLFTHRGGRRVSNRLLGFFFLTIGLNLTDNLLLIKGVYIDYPELGLWSVWLLLLFGPLLYLYTQSVVYRDFRLTLRKGWHFLPFVVLFLITEVYWLGGGPGGKRLRFGRGMAGRGPGYYLWGCVF